MYARQHIGLLLAFVVPVLLAACEGIRDGREECGIYLEFIYDLNMEYADAFDPQVGTVDVFVFDDRGLYRFARHARRGELVDGNRMFLGEGLGFGRYSLLTVGGLSDDFRVSDAAGQPLTPGQTRLEEVRIALERDAAVVGREFAPVWVGPAFDVNYRADLSVWPVRLVRNTNRFNLTLARRDGDAGTMPCTFEIVTPEGAVYGSDNAPLSDEAVTYVPYALLPEDLPGELSSGRLNTARLLSEAGDYRLRVLAAQTGEPLWDYDLMALLRSTKPDGPGGRELPLQEYLDRQSVWNFVILYEDGGSEGGFVAVAVRVNDWIIWLREIGV